MHILISTFFLLTLGMGWGSAFATSGWDNPPVGFFSLGASGKTPDQQDTSPRELERTAQHIYREALRLFSQGSYWECARELIILMDFHPKFSQIDGVIFYLAQCLYEMEIYKASSRLYTHLIAKYPQSAFVPNALFGLERINYQQGDYEESLNYYSTISQRYSRHQIHDSACYYAGQSYYNLKNYDRAIEVLQRINNRSNYYDYALYTTALSWLKKKE